MTKGAISLLLVVLAVYGAALFAQQSQYASSAVAKGENLSLLSQSAVNTLESVLSLEDIMDFDAEDDDSLDLDDEDDDGLAFEVLDDGVQLFSKTQKKTLKFRSLSYLFGVVNVGQAPDLKLGEFTCQSDCKRRAFQVEKVTNSSYRLMKVQYRGPFNGCSRTCDFNGGKQSAYFAQKVEALFHLADFNLPDLPWIHGKVSVPCRPTIGIDWHGFIVGDKRSVVQKSFEEGQKEPRAQCSMCDLEIITNGVKVDISNLPVRFWFCKHKRDGFKLKIELRKTY